MQIYGNFCDDDDETLVFVLRFSNQRKSSWSVRERNDDDDYRERVGGNCPLFGNEGLAG